MDVALLHVRMRKVDDGQICLVKCTAANRVKSSAATTTSSPDGRVPAQDETHQEEEGAWDLESEDASPEGGTYYAERVVGKRLSRTDGGSAANYGEKLEYRVQWYGYPGEDSWEPEENLWADGVDGERRKRSPAIDGYEKACKPWSAVALGALCRLVRRHQYESGSTSASASPLPLIKLPWDEVAKQLQEELKEATDDEQSYSSICKWACEVECWSHRLQQPFCDMVWYQLTLRRDWVRGPALSTCCTVYPSPISDCDCRVLRMGVFECSQSSRWGPLNFHDPLAQVRKGHRGGEGQSGRGQACETDEQACDTRKGVRGRRRRRRRRRVEPFAVAPGDGHSVRPSTIAATPAEHVWLPSCGLGRAAAAVPAVGECAEATTGLTRGVPLMLAGCGGVLLRARAGVAHDGRAAARCHASQARPQWSEEALAVLQRPTHRKTRERWQRAPDGLGLPSAQPFVSSTACASVSLWRPLHSNALTRT
jgi:hypothetical protein